MGQFMKISEAIKPGNVFLDVSASSKSNILKFIAGKAAAALGVSADDVYDAVQSRETLGSTGVGSGIAIPHAQLNGVVSPFALMTRLSRPIDFEAIDEAPVDIVCLILTPPGEQSQYLKLLSQFARQLRSSEVVKSIRSATQPEQIYEAMTGCER